ncbi:MAG: chorismate-binding protein [Alphaproteobacteria bacterium]|nr:chorismate-binding protein [Alphaproteobacteria bacterium]
MLDLFDAKKPFCLIKRRADTKILYLSGKVDFLDRLEQIPRKTGKPSSGSETFDSLSILPFRQVEELGFVAHHNNEKIICLQPNEQKWLEVDQCLSGLPDEPTALENEGSFSPDDAGYADCIQRIIDDEIGKGEGCNFVVPRRFRARLKDFSLSKALGCFRRILANEYGFYWGFLFYTGERYFIGATPERHISCHKGVVKMNPISGTLRKTEHMQDTVAAAMQDFLKDPKETFELLMVTDEELKMMAEICSSGGQVVGPMLKEMSKLIHTEYTLAGNSEQDIVSMLRKSMFAATVVGSPIENACRVIHRHDKESRRYYGSALALIGRDEEGKDTLDSPITIRTAEIDLNGNLEISVGTTIVRDSAPKDEVAETHAKAAGILKAFGFHQSQDASAYRLGENLYSEDVMIALSSRNTRLSRFWVEDQSLGGAIEQKLLSKKITIIDNEDNFTKMMQHIIQAQGATVRIVRHDRYDLASDDADLVILGPGPGDPRDLSNAKISKISKICHTLVEAKKPLFCVCLGHQVLCQELGFPIVQKRVPFQGIQVLIDLWGKKEHVGFYNAFVGKAGSDNRGLDVSFDQETGEIHAIKGRYFVGVQFHPESILTTNGFRIVQDILTRLLSDRS